MWLSFLILSQTWVRSGPECRLQSTRTDSPVPSRLFPAGRSVTSKPKSSLLLQKQWFITSFWSADEQDRRSTVINSSLDAWRIYRIFYLVCLQKQCARRCILVCSLPEPKPLSTPTWHSPLEPSEQPGWADWQQLRQTPVVHWHWTGDSCTGLP